MSSRSFGHLAADHADREAGTRERLAPDEALRKAQLDPDRAHLVLEQLAKRLDQLEVVTLGKPAHVVVRLDLGGAVAGAAAGLDHVRVERALDEELGALESRRLLLEHPDELLADDAPLGLRVDHALEAGEEPLGGVDMDQWDVEMVAERRRDLLALVLPHEAVVHEHAGQALAERAMHDQGRDRRVDAAGETADRAAAADLRPDRLDLLVDDRGRGSNRPRTRTPRRGSSSGSPVPCGVCTTSGWNWMPYSPRATD